MAYPIKVITSYVFGLDFQIMDSMNIIFGKRLFLFMQQYKLASVAKLTFNHLICGESSIIIE